MLEYTTQLTDFIRQELLHGRRLSLDEEVDLLNAGIIDSLGIVRLVTFIHEQLGVKVPDEDVVFENFRNIRMIGEYVAQRKLAAQGA
jgi:acyl carrier protein